MTTRATPRLDRLLENLAGALDARGAKADLARIIAREAGITHQAAKNRLTSILKRATVPNGEDTLILAEWIAARTARTAPAPATPRRREG